jgi:hypothetical protein
VYDAADAFGNRLARMSAFKMQSQDATDRPDENTSHGPTNMRAVMTFDPAPFFTLDPAQPVIPSPQSVQSMKSVVLYLFRAASDPGERCRF